LFSRLFAEKPSKKKLGALERAAIDGDRDEVNSLLKQCSDPLIIKKAIELANKAKWHAVSRDLRAALDNLKSNAKSKQSPPQADQEPSLPVNDNLRLRNLNGRLMKDHTFAERTDATGGENLNGWLPPLSREEIKAALITARAVLAGQVGIQENEMGDGVKLVGQFELLAEVGRGGFGAVYKARDVHLDQFVAVKELILEDPAPLKEEAKVLSELRHKNIVGFRQLFPDQQRWYMVMDYVEGDNLAKLISKGTLYEGGGDIALKRMLLIAQQSAEGLNYAHERGIIHQDVKPANVMVDLKGVAKVSDFGLAKARPQGAGYVPAGGRESIMVSRNGLTPAYCSPEQAKGQKLTKKTDTWSWGLSVLEMFAGEVTWRSGTAAHEALQRCVASKARREDIPPLPQRLTDLLGQCFQDEPKARPDMNEIVTILANIQGGGDANWFKRFFK